MKTVNCATKRFVREATATIERLERHHYVCRLVNHVKRVAENTFHRCSTAVVLRVRRVYRERRRISACNHCIPYDNNIISEPIFIRNYVKPLSLISQVDSRTGSFISFYIRLFVLLPFPFYSGHRLFGLRRTRIVSFHYLDERD